MASPSTAADQPEINLSHLLGRVWAAKFGILLFVLVITGLVYLFTQIAEPKYRSEAQLLIETQETAFTRPEVESGQVVEQIDERDVASEVQVLRSRDVALEVIERLGLAELEEFDPVRGGVSPIKGILALLGLTDNPLDLSASERVFRNFDEGLTVYSIPSSRVVVVSYESSDPELAARIANTVIDVYQATQQAAQATTTRSATSFLETEINQLRDQVEEAEAAVARYRATSGLLLGPNNTTLSSQQLSELSTELTRARADQSEAQSRAREIRALIASQGAQVALPEDFSTPLTQRLQEEQASIRATIAELSATLLPGHPRIRELNAQLADLGGQLRSEASRIAQRFDNAAQVASGRAQGLEDELAQLSAEAARIAEAEVELRALEREASAQRDLLQSYLVRFREAATRDEPALLPTNARVIQTAQIEREAVFPRTLPMIIIAFAGSLVFALLGVLSHAILSTAVPEDGRGAGVDGAARAEPDLRAAPVETHAPPPAPALATGQGAAVHRNAPDVFASPERREVPAMSSAISAERLAAASAIRTPPPRPAPAQPAAPMPQTYALGDPGDCRRLFAHLRRLGLGAQEGLRVTVGSSDASVHAGDVALRLGRATAQAGRSTVLVDCIGDLRDANLCPDGPGFYELVTGAVTFDAALHKDPKSGLHLVPAGFALAERSMIADDAADLVLSAFSTSYDAVVVNAGRDPQLLLECARINDVMVLGGQPNRIAALAQTLSSLVPRDRVIAVQLPVVQPVSIGSVPA